MSNSIKKGDRAYLKRILDFSGIGGPKIPMGTVMTVLIVRRAAHLKGELWVDMVGYGQRRMLASNVSKLCRRCKGRKRVQDPEMAGMSMPCPHCEGDGIEWY